MRFLHPEHDEHLELSPRTSSSEPRLLRRRLAARGRSPPDDFACGSHPIVSANMNAVTGKRMAETMARYGGLGVLPQDMALETVERIVQAHQDGRPRYDTPLVVTPEATLRDVQGIIRKRSHDLVVVVDDEKRPLGIVTHGRPARSRSVHAAGRLMSDQRSSPSRRRRRTATRSSDGGGAREGGTGPRRRRAGCIGVLTRDDAVRLELWRPRVDARASSWSRPRSASPRGRRRRQGAARARRVGASSSTRRTAISAACSRRSATVKAVGGRPRAHRRRQRLHRRRHARADRGRRRHREGQRRAGSDVHDAHADRRGPPDVHLGARLRPRGPPLGKHVWADGGVRHPRDVALYLAAGASRVMVGTALAGTYESPGDVKEDREGHLYKENYGMASGRAVSDRNERPRRLRAGEEGLLPRGHLDVAHLHPRGQRERRRDSRST
jgi:IMP dehydrogenase